MNQENRIMSLFSRINDFLLLNVLFVITSIPVITLGTSITALYSVALKMVKNEESYVVRDYLHAWKRNFKPATPAFLFFAVVFSILGMNIWISYQTDGTFYLFLRSLATIFLVCLFICVKYYFPVLARFDFTFRQVWLHIPHMIVTHAAYFFFLVLLNVPIVFLSVYSVYTACFTLVIGCIIGFAVLAYAEAFLFRRIFADYEIDG